MNPSPAARRLLLAFATLALLTAAPMVAADKAAADKASAEDPLGLPAKVREKLQLWSERYSRVAPDRKIVLEPEWRQAPSGFTVVRRRLVSSDDKFNENLPLLVTNSWSHVFVGQTMKLDDLGDTTTAEGAKAVSKLLTEKAGNPVEITWLKEKGPGGIISGRLVQVAEIGRIEMDCWLSNDGKFFFYGAFFSLDQDPRKERMKRMKLDGMPTTGPADALVTIVEFSDYECPSCGLRQPDIEAALAKFKGKVRLVHSDHPIWRMHKWAVTAAEGSRCVEKVSPEAYWKYKKLIYERQKDINDTNFEDIARPVVESLGLSFDEWNRCRKDGRTKPAIVRDLQQAFSLGVNGTPTLFVNGILVDFGVDKVLEKAIAQALAGR